MIDPLILVRAIHIGATVLASGTVAFRVWVTEPAAGATDFAALRRDLDRMTWSALAAAILSGVAWLVLLAADILGGSILDVCLHGGAWQVATDTRFGQVSCVRLVLALLLGGLTRWPAMRLLQSIVAVGFIALLALVGHAGATSGVAGRVHLISDMVHLLAAGVWLGGLPALALLLAKARRNDRPPWPEFAADATRRFSRLGIVSVAALLASGVINSWNLLAGPGELVATEYGRLVLLKIGLFAAMVGIASVNRYRLTPRMAAPATMRSLQRNTIGEIGLGLCVLLAVGTLGTMAPAVHVHATPVGIPPDAAFVHIHTSDVMADVTINPGRTGTAKATIRVLREDFSEFAAKDVRFELELPNGNTNPGARAAARKPDGTWEIERLEIRQPGIWTVRVTVTPDKGNPIILDAPLVIGR